MIDRARFGPDVRRLAALAWPVTVGQIAVLGFSTVDTVLLARHDASDLAALAIGVSAYATVFIGLMGLVAALGPIAGRLVGAQRHAEAGRQAWQAVWLSLVLTLPGVALLLFPHPFLWAAKATPAMAEKASAYMALLALGVPATLLFTVYRTFNVSIGRPKAVMRLQLAGFALKVLLSWMLVDGVAALGLPPLGVRGAALATSIVMWAQLGAGVWLLRREPHYEPYRLDDAAARRWDGASQRALWKLGGPMAASIMVEVSGFSLMAILIARIGQSAVAGHQIAVNVLSLLFMIPLGLANATTTLVAQRIGAGDLADARRLGWHGVTLGLMIAMAASVTVQLLRGPIVAAYGPAPEVAEVALAILAWVAVFHSVDAVQTIAAFTLRAWHVVTLPTVIYVLASWGLGLVGGYWYAYGGGATPSPVEGATRFWIMATLGMATAGTALTLLLGWIGRQRLREAGAAASG